MWVLDDLDDGDSVEITSPSANEWDIVFKSSHLVQVAENDLHPYLWLKKQEIVEVPARVCCGSCPSCGQH